MTTEMNTEKTASFEPLLTLRDLTKIIPLSYAGLYMLSKTENFPKPIFIGKRRRAWTQGSVRKWLDGQSAA